MKTLLECKKFGPAFNRPKPNFNNLAEAKRIVANGYTELNDIADIIESLMSAPDVIEETVVDRTPLPKRPRKRNRIDRICKLLNRIF